MVSRSTWFCTLVYPSTAKSHNINYNNKEIAVWLNRDQKSSRRIRAETRIVMSRQSPRIVAFVFVPKSVCDASLPPALNSEHPERDKTPAETLRGRRPAQGEPPPRRDV
ncbi:hypothetical protein EVAR_26429_1 [Eumeta japonica]|uniref:Uncharacterized protein n=1 Tax=Eumeta variegata TaxID=151549 RepID=A0A4C1VSI6_EUMVA|nr:hypothetical protein EVAR_26429_1 [Eumeta japonica]